MYKRVIVIALAFIGVVVGAGFASGQESLQYFVAHGRDGIVAAVAAAVLMALVGGAALQLGSFAGAKEHSSVFNRITHPIAAKALDLFIVITLFSIGFVMIAGAGSNLNQQFGLPIWVGSAIMAVLVIVTGMLDVDKVTSIIGGLTPFMIVMVLIASVYALINPDGTVDEMQVMSHTVEPAISNVVFSGINYVAFAFAVGASMMIVMGGDMFDVKAAGVGGILGGVMFGGLLVLSVLALFMKLPSVADSPMPMLELVNSMNPTLGLAMAIIIYAMIYNTATGMYYALAKRAEGYRPGWFKPTLILTVIVGFGLSFVGFESLVGNLYPAIGFVGVALTVLVLWAWWVARERIKKETERRGLIRALFRRRWQREYRYTKKDHEKLRKEIGESSLEDAELVTSLRDEVISEIEADPYATLEPELVERYGYDEENGFAKEEIDFRHPSEYEDGETIESVTAEKEAEASNGETTGPTEKFVDDVDPDAEDSEKPTND